MQGTQDDSRNIFQTLLENPEAFSSWMRYLVSPERSGYTERSSPCWTCLENLQGEVPWRHPDAQTTSTGSFQHEGASSSSNPLWISELLTLSLRLSPATLQKLGRLYPHSHSFGHYPKLVTIGEGWDVDVTGKLKASPAVSAPTSPQRPGTTPASLHYQLKLHFTITINKTPLYLNSVAWASNSLPTREEQFTVFQQRPMASDLEVLTLIPTASHSTAN